jgi:hypothetical protein
VKKQPLLILIGVVLFFLGIILSIFYRPYIYQNNLYDSHFADTIGSLFCVPSSTFFFRGISKNITFNKFIARTTIGYLLYEFLGLLKIQGVFDYYDIIAIFIGALLTYLIGIWFKIDKKE